MKTKQKQNKATRLKRRLAHLHVIAALILIVAANALLWFGVPGRASATPDGYIWYYEEQQYLSILNNHRASLGRGSLTASSCMSQAARAWSRQMAAVNTLYHSPSSHVEGYCGRVASEVALYMPWGGSAQEAFDQWYNSPPHRGIIESASETHTGVGFYWDKVHGKLWGTQVTLDCVNGACSSAVTAPASYILTPDASVCHTLTAPDSVKAGQTFFGALHWENTGNSSWFGGFKPASANGHWGITEASFGDVATGSYRLNPGLTAGFTHTFTAPSAPGVYDFSWHVKTPGGTQFGGTCSKKITVTGATSTQKPTSSGGSGSTGAPSQDEVTPSTEESKSGNNQGRSQKIAKDSDKPAAGQSSIKTAQDESIADRLKLTSAPGKIGLTVSSLLILGLLIIFHARLHLPHFSKNIAFKNKRKARRQTL